jgi:hypothetical protein
MRTWLDIRVNNSFTVRQNQFDITCIANMNAERNTIVDRYRVIAATYICYFRSHEAGKNLF